MIKLSVKGKRVIEFSQINIDLKFDTVGSSFGFDSFYNPDNTLHTDLFTPLNYDPVEIDYNDQRLLTGVILKTAFQRDSARSFVKVQGYSLPGIVQDISIPIDVFPLQYVDLSLNELAQKILNPVGVNFVIRNSANQAANEVIEEISAEPGKTIFQFIVETAAQKGIIVRHDQDGNLLFDLYQPGESVASIVEGDPHINSLASSFDGQKMHRTISTMGQDSFFRDGEREATITNSLIPINRPIIQELNTIEDVDAEAAATQIRSKELKSIFVDVTFDEVSVNNRILIPGDVVTLQAPSIRVSQSTRFMVLSNRIAITSKGENSKINLILEDALTGNQPAKFW